MTFLGGIALAFVPATADAQAEGAISAISLKSGQPVAPDALETGDQAVIDRENGAVSFAGYDVDLRNVSGAMGYSSAAGYVIVASGEAASGGETARAGEILILLPGGEGVISQLYDAGRYAGSWDQAAIDAHPAVYERLDNIAGRQKWKLFFGRLAPTSFNIAAPGSADQEAARRSVYGSAAIREIRFSDSGEETAGRAVVEGFTQALVRGDVEAVAALMDPAPYGGADLRNGGEDARLIMARKLIESADWAARLDGASPAPHDGGLWIVSSETFSTRLTVRAYEDFAFITNVDKGI